MSDNETAVTAQRSVATAMIGFVAAFSLHAIDHFRRGMSASPPAVMVGGTIQGLIVVTALVLILRGRPGARWAGIVVGFGSATLFVYAHVLPTFLPDYQDSFTAGPRINVNWFSWLTAVGEIGAGLILGFVGLRARRRADVEPPARPREVV
ncbi:hypothetical protein [Mycobacterium marseillense]|uniref:hypothetical protein n=1 Tax=Mycobacterium marseillense TaxID=701042 RepID=UPI000ACE97BC|nr:hypothetical protein [Mycobacterium marseillense]